MVFPEANSTENVVVVDASYFTIYNLYNKRPKTLSRGPESKLSSNTGTFGIRRANTSIQTYVSLLVGINSSHIFLRAICIYLR